MADDDKIFTCTNEELTYPKCFETACKAVYRGEKRYGLSWDDVEDAVSDRALKILVKKSGEAARSPEDTRYLTVGLLIVAGKRGCKEHLRARDGSHATAEDRWWDVIEWEKEIVNELRAMVRLYPDYAKMPLVKKQLARLESYLAAEDPQWEQKARTIKKKKGSPLPLTDSNKIAAAVQKRLLRDFKEQGVTHADIEAALTVALRDMIEPMSRDRKMLLRRTREECYSIYCGRHGLQQTAQLRFQRVTKLHLSIVEKLHSILDKHSDYSGIGAVERKLKEHDPILALGTPDWKEKLRATRQSSFRPKRVPWPEKNGNLEDFAAHQLHGPASFEKMQAVFLLPPGIETDLRLETESGTIRWIQLSSLDLPSTKENDWFEVAGRNVKQLLNKDLEKTFPRKLVLKADEYLHFMLNHLASSKKMNIYQQLALASGISPDKEQAEKVGRQRVRRLVERATRKIVAQFEAQGIHDIEFERNIALAHEEESSIEGGIQ